MAADSTIWYRVGYALERARTGIARSDEEAAGVGRRGHLKDRLEKPDWPTADEIMASGVAALAGRVLGVWRPARRVTVTRLLRAGLAGAGAALLVDLVRPLLRGHAELPQIDEETGARMLAGASQGLVYGATIEPRVPGPPLFKGAVFALAEYMAHPAGGLSHLLGAETPYGRLPIIREMLSDLEPQDREYVEQLVFGVALALLCGPAPPSNGSPPDGIDG